MTVKLVQDTISKEEIRNLSKWLNKTSQLTKGSETVLFEKEWSEWLGVKHSVFVNSGSSANLLLFLALSLLHKEKEAKTNKEISEKPYDKYSFNFTPSETTLKVIVPAVSWVTTVAPVMQFGMTPILCDCDENDLGLDVEHFKELCIRHKPDYAILVHVLGHANKIKEIKQICSEHNVILLEDCCESHGTTYDNVKVGTFGLASTFSFYYGHHMSTVEGGMICTNDTELYEYCIMLRSHGWIRDLPEDKKKFYKEKYKVSDFDSMFMFILPGLNVRSTDINAYLGRRQLLLLDEMIAKRNKAMEIFNSCFKNKIWTQKSDSSFVAPLAYGLISENRNKIAEALVASGIECRPLVCGSIEQHPFWYETYGKQNLKNATRVHKNGMYIPCHHKLKVNEIKQIAKIVLKNNE